MLSRITRPIARASLSLTAALGCLLLLTPDGRAQGKFVNYEVGAVSPIAIQTFAVGNLSRTVLMACNTANDGLEFYDAATLAFLKRIPTGLAPVTVRWDANSGCAYACNHLGDSITRVRVTATNGGGFVSLDIRLAGTMRVGDEPCDIAFVPGTTEAMVSTRSRSAVTRVNLATQQVLEWRHILDVNNSSTDHWAIKHPRTLAFVGNDRFYALDHQSDGMATDISLLAAIGPGGGTNPLYDAGAVRLKVNDLGTTHANFVINTAGTRMFVVGMRGNPGGANTEVGVGALPTGFVESWLWTVDLLPTPTVVGQSSASGSMPSINLNRDYSAPTLQQVAPSLALSQPTGIAIHEVAGQVTKVVITAFSSDAIAVLTPNANTPSGWDIRRTSLGVLDPSYSMVGPRAVVINRAGTTAYVLCSLDNSLRTVDISGTMPVLGSATSLLFDDTPLAIRAGREFLYGAQHSGNHMVSCSSCHIDGHTDGLAWTLNQGDQGMLPNHFINGAVPANWAANKGPMVTQSLRGLVNHDVPGAAQLLFTNAPYHWRGDRGDFAAFNGAFVDLMNRTGGQLTAAQMASYTTFIETVLHPPNCEQPIDRRLTGTMGGSNWDPMLGTRMKRGLKLYHGVNIATTCAHCHALPEGSGNRATQTFESSTQILHPIEPAALRNIFDFESGLQLGSGTVDLTPILVKKSGLFHDGFLAPTVGIGQFDFSSAHFVQLRFHDTMPGVYSTTSPQQYDAQTKQTLDLTEFVRALDTGSAPIIGWVYTCGTSATDNLKSMNQLLDQVQEANAGLVAHTNVASVERSYWYDLGQDRFRDDGTNGTLTPTALLGLATGNNLVVLQAVPVGSARRIADYARQAAIDTGVAPSNLVLDRMTLPTQWADGGDLQARWDPASGAPLQLYATAVVPRESHLRMIYMQSELIAAAQSGSDFGISTAAHRKHELPRRFRVAGNNIRPGAELEILMPGRNGAVIPLRMPIFPTKYKLAVTNQRIWETTVEADGEMTLALLCGGLFLPNVWDLIQFTSLTPPYPVLHPATDNNYAFVVHNADGTQAGGTSPLKVRHDR